MRRRSTRMACVAAAAALLWTGACATESGPADGGDADDGTMDREQDVDGGDADGDADDGAEADAPPDIAPDDADGGPDGEDADVEDAADGGGPPPRECVEERCGDGLDNDCDGVVDEECFCAPGEVGTCFRGDPRRRGLGICRDGTMICEGSGEFGLWGFCEGDGVGLDADLCDAAALDEDCDGAPNDGCDCSAGDPELACGTDVGECRPGVQRCIAGRWSECLGAIGPEPEECNLLDDDCDRGTDEGLLRLCGTSIGTCRQGYERCDRGAWSDCEGGRIPAAEVCDNLDNDCDGETDETVTRSCGITRGRCLAGVETCTAGAYGPCAGAIDPIAESCNGVDDDCDGTTDEGLTRSCGTDEGACVAGRQDCLGATGWSACLGSVGPATETCDGRLDEDCDGTTDEGCACASGAVRSCGTDEGACVAGTQVCGTSGDWGPCTGAVGPTLEECNLADDDCDGTTDEGCDCVTGATRSCGTDTGECVAGLETCDGTGHWGPCLGATAPVPEVCDGRDNDCDGSTDEGDICPRYPPVVECPGNRSVVAGTPTTLAGTGSDPDGGTVTFAWTVVTRPTGSTANPTPPNAATTVFTPDTPGTFTLRLCVTDDEMVSTCCTVAVSATPACTVPATPAITTCPVSWDRRPIVEFDPLPAGITYQLFKDADAAPYATITTAGYNYHRPASALGTGGPPPGGTTMAIYLKACRTADPTCCATTSPVTVGLIEACTTPIAATAENIVFSEYLIDGNGNPSTCPGDTCEAGEAIEITNLSNCPVTLNGNHFGYQNSSGAANRWMNFTAADVIPPRGVYVAIRNYPASTCSFPFYGPDDPGLFGLKISGLSMQGSSLSSGWFNNTGGGVSMLRIATGAWVSITGGTTLEVISPYLGTAPQCSSIGFNAIDDCGNISAISTPTAILTPNQLGRLWHPCDAVVAPNPPGCR